MITGAGGNFCSGGDVFEIIDPLTRKDMAGLREFTTMTGAVVKAMRHCPQPVIAAVDGICAGAGACAAIEASDAGARVTLFEVASASGGSTALSSAEVYLGGGGGTRVQKACGYTDSTEDMFQYLMAAGGDLADEAKVRLYCEESTEHFDWLVAMGASYKDSEYKERAIMALTDDCLLYTGSEKCWPFRDVAKPCPRGHNLEVEGDNGGPLLMKILTEQVEKRSIGVEYNARALTLIANDQGEVIGLVVRIEIICFRYISYLR